MTRTRRFNIAVAVVAISSLSNGDLLAKQQFNATTWLAEAKPLVDAKTVRAGGLLPEMPLTAKPGFGVVKPKPEAVLTTGFTQAKDGRFVAEQKPGDAPAEIVWKMPGIPDGPRLSGRVFLQVSHSDSVAHTGGETLAVYHNNAKLASIPLGDRQRLNYVTPLIPSQVPPDFRVPEEYPKSTDLASGYTIMNRRMFAAGDTLRIVAETPGRYDLRDFFLVPQPDTVPVMQPEILYPEVRVWSKGERAGDTQFAWVTRLPSRCILLWSRDRAAVADGTAEQREETAYAENHQHFTELGLKPGDTVYYRIFAEADDGRRITSDILEFTAPAPPRQAASGRFALTAVEPVPCLPHAAQAAAPFAPGVLADARHTVMVRKGTDERVPAQFDVVSRYPDNSVRWLAVRFQARPDTEYEVVYGPDLAAQSAPEPGLELSQTDGRVEIRDGQAAFQFDPAASAGFAGLQRADGQRLEAKDVRLSMTDAEGRLLPADVPKRLEIEREGREAVVVKAQGHFRDGDRRLFEYIARWTVRRGFPGLDLELTIGDDLPDMLEGKKTIHHFRNCYLDIRMPLDGPTRAAVAEGAEPVVVNGKNWRLLQVEENRLLRFADGVRAEQEEASRLTGHFAAGSGKQAVALAVQDFWQQYPKSFERDGDWLRIGLMPNFPGDCFPAYPEGVDAKYIKLYFYLENGLYRFMAGLRKTHRVTLALGETAAESVAPDRLLGSAVFYAAAPEYAARTGVFGPLRPADERYAAIDNWQRKGLKVYLDSREKGREYGLLNFGDWWGERGVNWGNLEYDLGQGASQQFLRTGDRGWLRVGYEAASHKADVDTVHYGANAGMQMQHGGGHTGREYFEAKGEFNYGTIRKLAGGGLYTPYVQSFHSGHMWSGGLCQYANLLDSARLRETARLFGDIRARLASIYELGDRGWNLHAFANLYNFEPDPFYLNAVRITLDRYDVKVDHIQGVSYGQTEHPYISYVSRHGLLAVRDYCGEPRAETIFLRSLKAMEAMWDDEVRGFVSPGHGWWSVREDQPIYTRILAEAYRLTGREEWRRILELHLQDGLNYIDNRSKSFSMNLLFAPHWPAVLDAAGIDDAVAVPTPGAVRAARSAGGRGGIVAEEQTAAPPPPRRRLSK